MITFHPGPLVCVTVPVAIILALWAVYYVSMVFLTHFGLLIRFVEWTNREHANLPAELHFPQQRLVSLGFQLVGVEKYRYLFSRQPRHIFIYTDPRQIVLAALNPTPIAVSFSYSLALRTHFEDESIVITRYPAGENISVVGLTTIRCTESIETAYEVHMDHVSKSVSLTGVSPLQIHSLPQIRELDNQYQGLYKFRENQSIYLKMLAKAVCLGLNSLSWWVFSDVVYPMTANDILFWTMVAVITSVGMIALSFYDGKKPLSYGKGKPKKIGDDR